jgi:tetratricopeptide (TPR) repeat protein
VIALATSGFGSLQDVGALFRQARFAEAAAQLSTVDATGRPGEDLLWQVRLAKQPNRLLALCETALADRDLPETTRQHFVLQAASVEFARGNHREVLSLLLPATDGSDRLAGVFYLLAGLSYRSLGATQRAREMLASFRVGDAAFPQARYELGRIGLLEGESTLALRYFESAERHADAARQPSLLLGRWEALRRSDRYDDAKAIERRLLGEHPHSLSALVLRDRLRTEQEQNEADLTAAAAPVVAGVDTATSAADAAATGPISVQLAAFSDRSLALAFVERWRRHLFDLRIDQEVGRHREPIYKIRTGHFGSRAEADAEAERIGKRFGLETLVVEVNR